MCLCPSPLVVFSAIPAQVRKQIAFFRVWCLVEVHAAADMHKLTDMPIIFKAGSFKSDPEASNGVVFVANWKMLNRLVYLVDVEQAEATVASDRDRIMTSIEEGVGIAALNAVVRGALAGAQGMSLLGDLAACVCCSACGDAGAMAVALAAPTTYLFAAASGGFLSVMKRLIAAGADVHAANDQGMTALVCAAQGGHIACVRELIALEVDLNAVNNDMSTALMLASMWGFDECVECLLESGASVDVENAANKTALHIATENGHVGCVAVLARFGANLVHDVEGLTPLAVAARAGFVECVQVLLDCGSDINTTSSERITSLNYACENAAHLDCVKLLLSRGADVTVLSDFGGSALSTACAHCGVDIIALLIEHGAWSLMTQADARGVTPLSLLKDRVKSLHATLLHSVEVFVKCRPLNDQDLLHGLVSNIEAGSDGKTVVYQQGKRTSHVTDGMFDAQATHTQAYLGMLQHLCEQMLSGTNVTVFAYGEGGSGKTHTLYGTPGDMGVAPMFVRDLCELRQASCHDIEIKACFLDLYCEKWIDWLWDLDNSDHKSADQSPPQLRVQKSPTGIELSNCVFRAITSVDQFLELYYSVLAVKGGRLSEAALGRSTALTSLHVTVYTRGTKKVLSSSKFNVADLAGSHRSAKTGCGGQGMKEGTSVNKSLSSIHDCLVGGQGYRNSNITFLLSDCLGGRGKVCFVGTIVPCEQVDETISTLMGVRRAMSYEEQRRSEGAEGSAARRSEVAELMKLIDDCSGAQNRSSLGGNEVKACEVRVAGGQ